MRKVSDDALKPVLGLRHQAVATFCEAHGLSYEWLLEGQGEMFRRGPKLVVDGETEIEP